MIFFLLIFQASSFEYLSAIVHSQDVSPVPHRNLWHPHLYLAKDSKGEYYEIRHSSQYYDVSISFLQTGSEDSAPGVMNCECRFVKEEVEVEEETTFLQVMTPSKVKPKTEQKDKEISIGAYVPKAHEQEYQPEAKKQELYTPDANTKSRNNDPRTEQVYREDHQGYPSKPEVILVQGGYPVEYQQPVYTQPVYTQPVYTQPVYTQPVYTQPVYSQPVYNNPNRYAENNPHGVNNGYSNPQGVNNGYINQQGVNNGYASQQGVNNGYANQQGVNNGYANPQGVNNGYVNNPQGVNTQSAYIAQTGNGVQGTYAGTGSYSPQAHSAQNGYNQAYNPQGYSQPQEFIQQPVYVHQSSYDQQPVLVQTYSQSSYNPQEYVNYQQGFVQTNYN